jgi:alkanesulfonate monooxygenase SsuD/methylene tetrahydromethanopterin reductase-like flavin-dependent oxidoreductase (luciferase family)
MFGISPTPYADSYAAIVEQVLAAELLGLDVVGIQDHPYQRRFLDTFALIGDLLARTERLRFFPDVASLPMRPPTMMAKAAASLDVMSGGRFELGIGSGAFWNAVAGMAGTVRGGGEQVAALEEAIAIVRGALDVDAERRVVRGAGPHYPVSGYPAGPPPAHRIEIWVGAMGPRMLDLIARSADGWIAGGGVSRAAEFARVRERLDAGATAAGRDPRAIRRIVNLSGLDAPGRGWIEQLVSWNSDVAMDGFILWPSDTGTAQIERFANEIVPAVRERVEANRANAGQ